MGRRFAALYSDGSFGVEAAGRDLIDARKRLLGSSDDADTEIVEVEIKVVQIHGKPKLVTEKTSSFCTCPTCGEEFEP